MRNFGKKNQLQGRPKPGLLQEVFELKLNLPADLLKRIQAEV